MMQSAPGHQFNYSLQDDWSFDPFGARFNTPQPRDQYSQGSRANYIDYNNYNDYNDYEAEENQDVVPETQQFQNIHVDDDDDDDQEENLAGERAKKVQKFAGRAERQIWTPNQEENLAKAWVHISVDKKVGNQQPRDGFWKRVLKHYATLEDGEVVPIHIVTLASQLPPDFLNLSPDKKLVVGFDCAGVELYPFPDAIYLVDGIKGGKLHVEAGLESRIRDG
ncbi:hypothetical protein QVD17_11978 [Tagetes erecta]|uniref:Uncharacterized protein n=1 Tax=Tagetes erecta TaxID=13708 RepID=A0AAD8L1Q7_TARER|nr:hypothetical protein QVD17_11978 [Tagetes erecta]